MGRSNSNRNNNSKGNCSRRSNDHGNGNRKGKNNRMAIVHVAFKSSSQAPPAAAHAQYIARDGQYQERGGLELVESGNMPEFAQADPHSFWVAADTHERANGRTYTELQIALPRELEPAQRQELAREATRELLGDRFAYTLAVHTPLAKDNIDQPHMHLMFSERAIDETTRGIPEERFFKRNGAKKDPTWNDRTKPDQVRELWVELMNCAMERAGQEQRLDPRSWAAQGREDLDALREPKLLGGDGREAAERQDQLDELRRKREDLPAPHLDQAAAVQELQKLAEAEVVRIERERDRELSLIDKLIERAREMAAKAKEVGEAARVLAQRGLDAVRERVPGLRPRETEVEAKPVAASPPAIAASKANVEEALARQLEQFRALGRQGRAEREQKLEQAKPQPEVAPDLQQEQKREQARQEVQQIERRGRGLGFSH